MILNNKAQMFSVWFPPGFFYKEVVDKWLPYIQKMKLPYNTIEDFMNSQIQQVTYPSIDIGTSDQGQGQYLISYTTGKELEPIIDKNLTITFKLTESYLTYWIIYYQVYWYLEYIKESKTQCFMNTINLSFLNDAGLSLVNFHYKYIIPVSIGNFNLSYASQVAAYNTFTWNIKYNRFDID